jgi:hypothetical protein
VRIIDRWDFLQLLIQWFLGKRQNKALKAIQAYNKLFMDEVMLELTDIYTRLEKDGRMTYQDVMKFQDLTKLQKKVFKSSKVLGDKVQNEMISLLEDTYDFSYSFMSYNIEMEAEVMLQNTSPDLPNILKQVWNNPIYGLHLTPAMEHNRTKIVKDINGAIERGLLAGENYAGIARQIQGVFASSVRRSNVIARTEVHRVREQATQESSMNAHEQGVKMVKIWRNMADERVRETKKADHIAIENQTRFTDEPFIAASGAQGMSPGTMGRAEEDIQCRCYASRRIAGLGEGVEKVVFPNKSYDQWKEDRVKRPVTKKKPLPKNRFVKEKPKPKPKVKPVEKPKEPEKSFNEKITEIENEIRDKEVEHGVILDRKGNILARQKGEVFSVQFSGDDVALMEGNIFTHNHPNSDSFSARDIMSLKDGKLAEVRAVGEDGTYIANVRDKKFYSLSNDDIENKYNTKIKEMVPKYQKMLNEGAFKDVDEGHKMMSAEVWKLLEDDLGINYRLKKRR